jgi:DNA polymerase-3 subunit epsilon
MSSGVASLWRWLAGASRQDVGVATAERWVVIDTETAGLDPDRDPLLAIGAVAVDDDGIVLDDSFEVFVRNVPAGNAANIVVHGIGHAAQATGTPPPAALAAFRDWTAGAPRVAFHADFDRAVLRKSFRRADVPDTDAPWLDLAPLAAALAQDAYRRGAKSLDEWLATFGIECSLRHNAGADALATAELLLRLRAIGARQGRVGFDALATTARQGKWLGTGP